MAYAFPIIKFYLNDSEIDRIIYEYHAPKWWTHDLQITFSILKSMHNNETNNYILADWIESYFTLIPTNGVSYIYSCAFYITHRDSYTQDKLDVLLHTFPFSKNFIYKMLDVAIEKERFDLVVVIEKFIAEQCFYEDNVIDKFAL